MDIEFKSNYLVCIERKEDVNYVVARSYSMKKAEELATVAKSYWPNEEIYISIEKVAVNDPLQHLQLESSNNLKRNQNQICICGKNIGGCIGNLSCKCSAIASCKQVTEENPLDYENYGYQKAPTLETAFVDVISLKRGILEVIIPEWDPDEAIALQQNEVPTTLKKVIQPGIRLLAEINLDANKVADLIFENLRLYEEEPELEEIEEVVEEPIEQEPDVFESEEEIIEEDLSEDSQT